MTWKPGLCALMLVACDFSIDDIQLDHRPQQVSGDSRVQDSAVPPDVGMSNRESGDASAMTRSPVSDSVASDGGGAAEVSNAPAHPDKRIPAVSQLDGGTELRTFDARSEPLDVGDAPVDAHPQSQDDAIDSGVDEDDGGSPLPSLCGVGFGCVRVVLHISADFGPATTDGVIELSDGTRSVETQVVNNNGPQVWLPIDRSLIARTTVPGFWTDAVLFMVSASDGAQPNVITYVFSTSAISAFTMPVGQVLDETKGFVAIDFYANYPNAGMDLGAPSDPPVVQGPLMLMVSQTLVAAGGNLMLIGNVQPGKLSPVPTAPSSLHCSLVVNDLEYYIVAPMTVLRFFVRCRAAGP